MNNLHPIMAQALQPFAPPQAHQVYRVAINLAGDKRIVHVLAPNTCAAISRSIELLLNDDDEIPAEGINISARVAE